MFLIILGNRRAPYFGYLRQATAFVRHIAVFPPVWGFSRITSIAKVSFGESPTSVGDITVAKKAVEMRSSFVFIGCWLLNRFEILSPSVCMLGGIAVIHCYQDLGTCFQLSEF